MRNAVVVIFVLLAVLLSPTVRAAEALTSFVSYLDGSIDIAPDGSVQGYSLPSLNASGNRALVHAIDRRIRSWRFEPVADAGHPVIAHVLLDITLQADASTAGDLVVSIAKVDFIDAPGADATGKPATPMSPPIYPSAALDAEVGANVMMVFEIDATGRVLQDDVYGMDLLLPRAIGSSEKTRYVQSFRDATLAAAKSWVIPASYHTSACGEPCVLAVPVRFYPCNCSSGISWTGLQSYPVPVVPWASRSAQIVQYEANGAAASTRKLLDPTQAEGRL